MSKTREKALEAALRKVRLKITGGDGNNLSARKINERVLEIVNSVLGEQAEAKAKAAKYHKSMCPGCDGRLVSMHATVLKQCAQCGGLIGEAPRSEIAHFVNLEKMTSDCDANERAVYFDFMIMGGRKDRVHGWYDPKSKLVTQFG